MQKNNFKRFICTPSQDYHLHFLQIVVEGEMVTGAVARRVGCDQFQVGLKSLLEPTVAKCQVSDWVRSVVEEEHAWHNGGQ